MRKLMSKRWTLLGLTAVIFLAACTGETNNDESVVEETAVAVCGNPEPGIDQGDTYIVGECEWLTRIAKRLGISYESLIGVNSQIENPNIIYPGQVINLPPR